MVCFAAPWLTRVGLLVEKQLRLAPFDLRGFLADASLALLVLGVAGFSLATRRWWGRAIGCA